MNEDNSRHIVQVLRMGAGEELRLTDGRGALITGAIVEPNKKKCRVAVRSAVVVPAPERRVSIAISPTKNASRFEWFLEKATEIGVGEIIPLMTERTERQHLRMDRLENILVSAMLQSQQAWMPVLRAATSFGELISAEGYDRRFIAMLGDRVTVSLEAGAGTSLLLIGPEGDFTVREAESALGREFVPVTLGRNRLRTETAGVVAATLLCIG